MSFLQLIALNFSHFEVEDDLDCSYDSLCLYNGTLEDGDNWFDQKVGCYCGFASGLNVATNSSSITLVFESDDTKKETGFEIFVSYYEGKL